MRQSYLDTNNVNLFDNFAGMGGAGSFKNPINFKLGFAGSSYSNTTGPEGFIDIDGKWRDPNGTIVTLADNKITGHPMKSNIEFTYTTPRKISAYFDANQAIGTINTDGKTITWSTGGQWTKAEPDASNMSVVGKYRDPEGFILYLTKDYLKNHLGEKFGYVYAAADKIKIIGADGKEVIGTISADGKLITLNKRVNRDGIVLYDKDHPEVWYELENAPQNWIDHPEKYKKEIRSFEYMAPNGYWEKIDNTDLEAIQQAINNANQQQRDKIKARMDSLIDAGQATFTKPNGEIIDLTKPSNDVQEQAIIDAYHATKNVGIVELYKSHKGMFLLGFAALLIGGLALWKGADLIKAVKN